MAASAVINTVEELLRNLEENCDKHLNLYKDDYLDKCKLRCSKQLSQLTSICDGKEENSSYILKEYVRSLLDLTYFEENLLVDSNFSDPNAKEQLQRLLDSLSQPDKILQQLYGWGKKDIDVLGVEICECLSWRKGALLYMYCHCMLNNDVKRTIRQEDKEFITQGLICGVTHLQQMLTYRGLTEDELFKKGGFSDTHVLAMMYLGEMCCWYLQFADAKSSDFKAMDIGYNILSEYIRIVEGPLRNHGWKSQRAKELLMSLGQKSIL